LFASDYCSNINPVEDEKINFISQLASINIGSVGVSGFFNTCVEMVAGYETNSWIDPIIPDPSITIGNVCQNLATLYS